MAFPPASTDADQLSEFFRGDLESSFEATVNTVVVDDPDKLIRGLEDGSVDAALLDPASLLVARDRFDFEIALQQVVDGDTVDDVVWVTNAPGRFCSTKSVRKDGWEYCNGTANDSSEAAGSAELRQLGAPVMLGGRDSAEYLFAAMQLAAIGAQDMIDPTPAPDIAARLRTVCSGSVAAISAGVLDDVAPRCDLTVFARTVAFPTPAVVIGPGLPPEMRLRTALAFMGYDAWAEVSGQEANLDTIYGVENLKSANEIHDASGVDPLTTLRALPPIDPVALEVIRNELASERH